MFGPCTQNSLTVDPELHVSSINLVASSMFMSVEPDPSASADIVCKWPCWWQCLSHLLMTLLVMDTAAQLHAFWDQYMLPQAADIVQVCWPNACLLCWRHALRHRVFASTQPVRAQLWQAAAQAALASGLENQRRMVVCAQQTGGLTC